MNIYFLNTLSAGCDEIERVRNRIGVKGVIGLSERQPGNVISGYVYQADWCCKRDIPFIEVNSYTLKDPEDKARLLALDIDLLVVSGWQRLIPEWLIKHCRYGAIGAHGSAEGITRGRGRSPQNWALILGHKEFSISIFKIDPEVDSGDIIDSRIFRYTDTDDIKISYYKVALLVGDMIADAVLSGRIEKGEGEKQDNEESFYLPQRNPDDGFIDWFRTTNEIDRFIRALTKPYPGATSNFEDGTLTVWKARPFELDLYLGEENVEAGTIICRFYNNELLVKTGDGFLFIDEYEVEPKHVSDKLQVGKKLLSVDFREQIQDIVDRHKLKNSQQRLSADIERLLK